MKNVIYVLILPMVVVSGIVFANRETKSETSYNPSLKPLAVADTAASSEAIRKWKASFRGSIFKEWETLFEREKVLASGVKIRQHLTDFTSMQAVVTSLSIPSRANDNALGLKGVMVSINGVTYIVEFDSANFQQLKVNDKIVIKSHSAGYKPDYSYLVISGDYIERDNKVIFKREVNTVGC
ncbi:MAG: hypothetical protein V4619_15580 [Bacteroidota bacterium]